MAINGLYFDTTGAAESYTKEMLKELGTCEIFETHPRFLFFQDLLLKYHHDPTEKIGEGIRGFKFTRHPDGVTTPEVIHPNGSTTIFSIKGCFKTYDPMEDLEQACRTSEYYQLNLEKNRTNVCAMCGMTGRTEIDHIIPFCKIFPEFITLMESKNISLPTSFNRVVNGSLVVKEFKPSESDFETTWIDFVVSNYPNNYQPLCVSCNRAKGGKYEGKKRARIEERLPAENTTVDSLDREERSPKKRMTKRKKEERPL